MNPWEMTEEELSSVSTVDNSTSTNNIKPWEMSTDDVSNYISTLPSNNNPTDLPKDVTKLQSTDSMSLVGSLAGNEQIENPFVSGKPKEEPIMDLTAKRFNEGQLTAEDLSQRKASDVVATVENIRQKYSTLGKEALGFFGNEEARQSAKNDTAILKQNILKELKDQGFDNPRLGEDGEILIDVDGNPVDASSDIGQQLIKSKFEIGAAVAGGIGGARAGAAAGSFFGPVGTGVGGVVGGALGSAGAVMLGRGADILLNDMDMVNKVDDELVYDQMTEAGIMDLLAGPAAYAVGKVASTTAKSGVALAKRARQIYRTIKDGNMEGAVEQAMKHFNKTRPEAEEAVRKLESLIGPLQGSDDDKILTALTRMYQGGDDLVNKANYINPDASANVAKSIRDTAESVIKESENLYTSDKNIYESYTQGMEKYKGDVKKYFKTMKDSGSQFTEGFQYNYDELNINPIISELRDTTMGSSMYKKIADRLNVIESFSDKSSFNDLIELRKEINSLYGKVKDKGYNEVGSILKIRDNIDSMIKQGADTYIPNSDVWLKNWDNANQEYAKMKALDSNVLYKALSRKGVSNDTVSKMFAKFSFAEDNTFYEVMEKLPKSTQRDVEATVIQDLTKRFTAGEEGGFRAIAYPALNEELQKITFNTPESKQYAELISSMADVFKNDAVLNKITGKIEMPVFQTYLTADPVMRLKYWASSKIFNYTAQLVGGKQADALALVKNTARVLENPLSAVDVNRVKGQLGRDTRNTTILPEFEKDLAEIRDMYIQRQNKIKEMMGVNMPPRLVQLFKEPSTMYATSKGVVSDNLYAFDDPILKNFDLENAKAMDILSGYLSAYSKKEPNLVVESAMKYLDDNRFNGVMKSVANKLAVDDSIGNAKLVANTIKAESEILSKRIQKDTGLVPPKEMIDKITAIKFKEIMENCNGK